MKVNITTIDAFTDKPFSGNPAAVCILDLPGDDHWMQAVASEMNLAETCFLYPFQDGYNLRWFSPEMEVPLCGHATLASAHLLYENGIISKSKEIKFYTLSGVLTAKNEGGWIVLDFPSEPPQSIDLDEKLEILLGRKPLFTGAYRMGLVVELDDEAKVRNFKPDFNKIQQIAKALLITAKGTGEFDMVSRFFAPGYGVNEDPVTGSAHCCLTPYWSKKLQKNELTAFQASKRGGVLKLKMDGERVKLIGKAVTVLKGEFLF